MTGVMGHPGVAAAVADSALCLLVGTRMTVTARTGLDDALASVPTISIGSAPPYLPCTHVHTDDLRGSLSLLTRQLSGRARPTRMRVPDMVPRTELQPPAYDGPGVRYRDAMTVLDAALPDGVDIVVDAGNTGAAAIHHLPVRRDGRFVVALGMGGMGYSFGAGIGMAFARGRRTVVIAGDGAFYMHGMEIHTAMQYRLPVTFVLFDNHAHAMCVTREQLFYGDLYSYNRFGPSRSGGGLAAMFPGLPSVDVADIDELPAALRAALDVDGPSVVSLECSADEIPPFAPFLAEPSPERLAQTIFRTRRRTIPMTLSRLTTFLPHRQHRPDRRVIRIETSPREKATPIIMEMMRSVYPHDQVFGAVLHRQRLHRLPARRAVRLPVRHPLPGGVDLQPARLHPDRRTRPVAGLRPARLGDRDLHPHGRQPRRHDRRLPLRLGSGRAPVDDLPDAGRRRAGGARQARLGGAVDQLPPPVLRRQPLPGDRAAAAPGVGG